ncbi:MAG: hypothetical protein U9O50_08390 [Acidobacteriota bacterium]|nr:hypothetical protein [Acidobacteriota bacterium]
MRCLYILIDSSTKGVKKDTKKTKYGESSAFWCAFRNKLEGMPCRAGFIYSNYEGTNKIFFDGVIRALESCYYLVRQGWIVKVMGDNKPVIKILRGEWQAIELKPFYNQVKEIERKYRGKEISYDYMGEETEIYKKVDEGAKHYRNFIKQKFEKTEKPKNK